MYGRSMPLPSPFVEEGVAALQEVRVHGGEVPAFFVVELVEGEHVAHRGHVDLEGPTGGGRHVGDPAVLRITMRSPASSSAFMMSLSRLPPVFSW